MNVIFVDIDGPLLPGKMNLFRENRHNVAKAIPKFDEFAIRCFNLWAKYGKAKIVFSTYWADYFSADELKNIMHKNGLAFDYHEDVLTPKRSSSTRNQEIYEWLIEHPEVEHWIAVDDDTNCRHLEQQVADHFQPKLAEGRWIEVNYNNGITLENFYDGCNGLGVNSHEALSNEFIQQMPGEKHTGSLW